MATDGQAVCSRLTRRVSSRNDKAADKISPDNIFLGVGSDEAIDMIIRVACTPRVDSILITPPTYGMYSVCAHIHDVDIVSVPLHVERPDENPNGLKVVLGATGSSHWLLVLIGLNCTGEPATADVPH